MTIPKRFFEGQTPPDLHIESMDNIDWYNEMIRRSFEGYEWKGTRFTADQWWFYNLCPMPIFKLDKNGVPTKDFDMGFPYWSQEDDYLFKQIEEADQDDKGVFLFTGRGYGKTQIVLSIGGKIFYLKNVESRLKHLIISASGDAHANATFKKMSQLIAAVNKAHPTLAINLLKENEDEIIAGTEKFENGKWDKRTKGLTEKIVYGSLAGKTKGRRIDFQLYEEAGDWTGAASLKECIAASRGTMWVGATKLCREFIIGTGGTVFSDQAKEVCYNPDAYGLYKVKNWTERGTGIVIPAFKKYGGYWEKTGISDHVGAQAAIDKMLADAKTDPDPTLYNKLRQEYPDNIEQMFQRKGGNRFPQDKLAKQHTRLTTNIENRRGEYGYLHWKRDGGKIVGVEWEPNNNGKIWILEHPAKDDEGNPYPNLYIGGYDGIDVGQTEAVTKNGSRGSLSIKKRMLPGKPSQVYVCHYVDRPAEVDEFYENSDKIMYYFGAVVNIEDSKRGIVGYLKSRKRLYRLMKRPRLTLANVESENQSNLIGTTPTVKNFQYGENFLVAYLKEHADQVFFVPALEDLRDFTMDNRTEHDITVSMFMCELAEDEFMDVDVIKPKPKSTLDKQYGYYTDSKGIKRFGEIPKNRLGEQFNFKVDQETQDYVDRNANYFADTL